MCFAPLSPTFRSYPSPPKASHVRRIAGSSGEGFHSYRELGRPVGQERGLRKLVVTRKDKRVVDGV